METGLRFVGGEAATLEEEELIPASELNPAYKLTRLI